MIDGKQLWKERLIAYVAQVRRYGRYMFNDHLLIVLFIAVGAGAYVYKQWTDSLQQFPYAIVASIIFAFVLTSSGVRTLLKEADTVFLLPVERNMRPYFFRAGVYSFVVHMSICMMIAIALFPLHRTFSSQSFVLLCVVLFPLKGWNMLVQWKEDAFSQRSLFHRCIRFLLNVMAMYFFLVGAYAFVVTMAVIMMIVARYITRSVKNIPLKWDVLLEDETRRMQSFYRVVHLFVDVPHLRKTVKKRYWLSPLLRIVDRATKQAYTYLHVRTFVRSGEYLGIVTRLTAIGAIFIYTIPTGYVFFSLLFTYATALQLLPLFSHHRSHPMLALYPLTMTKRRQSVLGIWLIVFGMQTALFTMLSTFIVSLSAGTAVLIAEGLLCTLLIMYVKKKWKEAE
ncbi:ABC transporter permease [Anoxybacillus sp. ST4]|uniref:ABC transporter permease n=1 Tax=Anoxybacillus sp. ST4 TaxID=2864181 RepID=UPI001C63D718|nr:ABC transporter permease [Anoxybacillus sp. ST4]MBW7650973.1 ABC transporter permease [Anoxybacillus sp. ST4]